jgi:dihydrofolate synthase/folylpolyglutamate synthase
LGKDNLLIVHVAGTNGKGSVCYKIAKTFQLAGYKTGLFTGPHISSFRERIQINSVPISENDVSDYIPNILSILERNQIPASFFEVTTALAFSYFNARNVDVVVLETGLGGRLDATNVIKRPTLSIITSIGLDHTKILGDTIELIAKEKAGKLY